ncbi:MAG: hypothetical protein V2G42_00035 [bacterium JZ-2024 1]
MEEILYSPGESRLSAIAVILTIDLAGGLIPSLKLKVICRCVPDVRFVDARLVYLAANVIPTVPLLPIWGRICSSLLSWPPVTIRRKLAFPVASRSMIFQLLVTELFAREWLFWSSFGIPLVSRRRSAPPFPLRPISFITPSLSKAEFSP